MTSTSTATFALRGDAVVVHCGGISQNEAATLRLPGVEPTDGGATDAGVVIGVPRRHLVLALTKNELEVWNASRTYDPRFLAGSIPMGFIAGARFVRDARPVFSHHQLRIVLINESRLFVAVRRSQADAAEELAIRLRP